MLLGNIDTHMAVGLEELEGSGRECDSPRKRPVPWFGVMGSFMSAVAGGGSVFMSLWKIWVLGIAVIRGSVYHCMTLGTSLGRELDSFATSCSTSLQECAKLMASG